MTVRKGLRRDARGAGLVEFALVAPVLLLFLVGVAQLGLLFFANADMRNAVAAGARLASIYPRPEDQRVIDAVSAGIVDLDSRHLTGPVIEHGTDENGHAFALISMSYSVPLDFVFFKTAPVRLSESRRVFTQPAAGE
jgi:hypothetical protein